MIGEYVHRFREKRDSSIYKDGFTLVELMVVTAILAILASVAVPAYVNYINRARQGEAVMALMTARMEQEVFWEENRRYSGTIGLLSSFSGTSVFSTHPNDPGKEYRIQVISADVNGFELMAERTVGNTFDRVRLLVTANTFDARPEVLNEGALSFSIFKWIFD